MKKSPVYSTMYLAFNRVLVYFFPILFFACSDNQVKSENTLTILDFEKGIQHAMLPRLSSYCSSIEYIPLQTDTAAVLSFIVPKRVAVTQNYLCIIDPMSKRSKLFDQHGKYIRTIGSVGKGSGEYINPSGPVIDEEKGNILFYDSNNLIIYDTAGFFIKTISLEKFRSKGSYLDNLSWLGRDRFYLDKTKSREDIVGFLILDMQGELLFSYEPPKKNPDEIVPYRTRTLSNGAVVMEQQDQSSYAYMYNDHLHFVSATNDTIFAFTPQYEKIPVYLKYWGRYKDRPDGSNKDYARLTGSFLIETDRALFFNLTFSEQKSYNKPATQKGAAIYNKTNGILSAITYDPNYDATGLLNDLDNGAPFWPERIAGNKLYQFMNAAEFIRLSEKSNSGPMRKVAATLAEHSNPVMIVATLK